MPEAVWMGLFFRNARSFCNRKKHFINADPCNRECGIATENHAFGKVSAAAVIAQLLNQAVGEINFTLLSFAENINFVLPQYFSASVRIMQ